jgi:hypothetical protein
MHDPRMLSDSALSALRGQDADLRQQLTLHLASIPEGVTEQDILEVGAYAVDANHMCMHCSCCH